MPDTPEVLLAKQNQINYSEVSNVFVLRDHFFSYTVLYRSDLQRFMSFFRNSINLAWMKPREKAMICG